METSIRAKVVTGLLVALRERSPRVMCLGTGRSSSISRAIHSLGAKVVPGTAGDVSRRIAGVDVLLLSPLRTNTGRRQMDEALAAARYRGMPIVIDLTGALKLRRSVPAVRRIIAAATWPVLSGTSDELSAFANPAGKRTDPVRLAAEILQSGGLAAIRGSTGMVTDGKNVLRVDAGHDWLETAAPAGGLAAGSIAAFLSVAHLADFITVTAVALACLGQAADRASRRAKSHAMESLVVKELDALSAGAARSGARS